jgi:hypothetical protein
VPKLATKAPELNYNPTEAESSHFVLISGTEVAAMGDEDTVVLTPEEKDKILKDVPEEEQQDEDENED